MENQTELYKIAAAYLHGFKKSKLKILLKRIGSLDSIFEYSYSKLEYASGLSLDILKKTEREKALKQAQLNLEFNQLHDIRSLFYTDNAYPYQLKECKDGPVQLNILGKLNLQNKKIVSVVGTRKSSPASKQIVEQLISSLKGSGVLVVSGLASGIDTLVHQYCIKHKVPTIAILGHGLKMIYPRENRTLAKEIIASGGALISEFHFNQKPSKYTFPQRNRIIAGVADATIVIESPLKGGSMITARLANSYSREVMAFPNSITQNDLAGCNQLIKTNLAHIITAPSDLFELMNWKINPQEEEEEEEAISHLTLSTEERGLVQTIKEHKEVHIDRLFDSSQLHPSTIQSLLMQLELKNYILNSSGLFYSSRV